MVTPRVFASVKKLFFKIETTLIASSPSCSPLMEERNDPQRVLVSLQEQQRDRTRLHAQGN